jgi:hypothetical protein
VTVNEKDRTPSQEMAAVEGPVEEIGELQIDLAAVLADVLEKRQAVKRYFGETDDEAEKEIARIVAAFTAANRRVVSSRLLRAYMTNRYPRVQTIEPKV